MAPTEEEPAIKQTDLAGKPAKRGRIKYRKLFSKRSKKKAVEAPHIEPRADSESEE
jgi:hypothetical protein